MDIKELNKTQLILLSLLITFVVSIATGIVTVSLMQQMPQSVPKVINNVIQRTIEKVTTVPAPTDTKNNSTAPVAPAVTGSDDVVVAIYPLDKTEKPNTTTSTDGENKQTDGTQVDTKNDTTTDNENTKNDNANQDTNTGTDLNEKNEPADTTPAEPKALGNGVIISDVGLILVDSSILTKDKVYKVILGGKDFDATIVQKFGNGFTVLKISPKKTEKTSDAKEVAKKDGELSASAGDAVKP